MATAGGRYTFSDLHNPLFLHPSDGPLSISVPKLQGAIDYRSWKRSFEIQLAAKRKLGFVTGTIARSTTDEANGIQWDTCNSLVISWLHNNVSDSIRKSILFVESASEIWSQLEKRFLLTNGSRKYKLNKDLFALHQNKRHVADYFTNMSEIWEEIDSLNNLPAISGITPEITKLLSAISTMKEEAKLFQFLNGLDDDFASQRSQLLMMTPLPSVEVACSVIQQEESQKEVLKNKILNDFEASAMYSRGTVSRSALQCTACQGTGHTSERCWTVVGYPPWHLHHKAKPQRGRFSRQPNRANSSSRSNFNSKMSNNAQFVHDTSDNTEVQTVSLTADQLQHLMKLLPQNSDSQSTSNDEYENIFSGMVTCCMINASSTSNWILDSGASDHMVNSLSQLQHLRPAPANCAINLPNGEVAQITHIGDFNLKNGIMLKDVLFVPTFKHNLLSIHKLSHDNACHVQFHPETCNIVRNADNLFLAKGHLENGLYYLSDSLSRSHACLNADNLNGL